MPIRGGGLSQTSADDRYVKKTGDTMLGDLVFPVTGFVMLDSNGVQWRVTVNTSGALVTTQIVTGGSIQFLFGGYLPI